MIEELIARLRGADKWPETEATVTSVDRVPPQGKSPGSATVSFYYRPPGAETQSGEFTVDPESSLYNVDEKDTFPVHFNPAHPEKYFSSEYTIPFIIKFYVILIAVFAAVFLYALL
jgi:hypothetical protein